MAWNPHYIPLVVFFPIAACAVHSTLLVTRNAVRPSLSDDLYCDATDPMWYVSLCIFGLLPIHPFRLRLVGYAGVPLIVTIPCLILSILTGFRLFKMMRKHLTDDTYSGDVYYDGPLSTDDFRGQRRRRQTHGLTAFLPCPAKPWFKNSDAPFPASSVAFSTHHDVAGKQQHPLHEHPFPPVDPLTGKAYSPSLEENDAIPCASIAAPVHVANVNTLHPFDRPHFKNHTLNVSAHGRSGRGGSSTPDSAFSSTMPIFASNSSVPVEKMQTSGTSLPLQTGGEGCDVKVSLAIATGDDPSGSGVEDGDSVVEDEMVGLAVTTDEPNFRLPTPTPTLRLKTPSPLKGTRASPTPSDTQTAHDTPRPQNMVSQHDVHSFTLGSGPGGGSGDRARSYESITRTLASPQHPLLRLAHTNHSAPYAFSSPGPSATQISGHQRQASFVSSSPTFYSVSYPIPGREDRDPLPFSPASAASFQSPRTPKDMGIDLMLNTGLCRPESHASDHEDQDDGGKAIPRASWDDDEVLDVQGVMRTVKPRDPRERLGMYNPTLSERRKRMLQQKQQAQTARGAKLGSALCRLVLFQILFFVVQLLASLSSILDVVHGRITPFGTQHIALLLAAWGPLIIFGAFFVL